MSGEKMESEDTPLKTEPQPMEIEREKLEAGIIESVESMLGVKSYGPIVEIKSQVGLEPIMGIGSKAKLEKKEETSSNEGLEPRTSESHELYDQVVGTGSTARIDRTGSTEGFKERHSTLKLPAKSQKSQIILSDIVVGPGLRVASLLKTRKSQIVNKKTSSLIASKLGPLKGWKSQVIMSTVGSGSAPNTMSKPQLTLPEVQVQVHKPKTELISKLKNLKSQLMLSEIKVGAGLETHDKTQSKTSDSGGLKQLHSILTGESKSEKSHSVTSDERFLAASSQNSDFADYYHKPSPFSTRWVRGYNSKVPVINLNKNGSTVLFYAAVNFGILYNWTTNSMKILEGHKHIVTNIAADADARWFVTADSGPENIITIWNAETFYPQKTIFSPHGAVKLSKLALSADAKYLLSLAYSDKANLNFWIWSFGLDVPHASLQVDIPPNGVVAMGFNPENSQQFLLMTKQEIWIGASLKIFALERGVLKETDNYELKIRCPPKKLAGVDPGSFTCFTFVANTSQVLVATSRGAVLVYGYSMEFQENVDFKDLDYQDLRFVKVVKVEKHRINSINSIDGILVMGNHYGEIRFYDEQLLLKYWVHGFRHDGIRGISFNLSPRSYQILDPKCNTKCFCWEQVVVEVDPLTGVCKQKLMKSKLPMDATTRNRPFLVRDFVVNSHNQGIGFVDFATEKLQTIVDCKISPALSIDVHPEKPFLVLGYADGMIELFNFIQHHLFVRIDTRKHFTVEIQPKPDSTKVLNHVSQILAFRYALALTTLQGAGERRPFEMEGLFYTSVGLHLACGMNTGELIFLNPTTISVLTVKPHTDTSHSIKEISYSPDSNTLATADVGKTVCVYKYSCDALGWVFIGKHRAHYKDISTLLFTPEQNEDGNYKLLSIGLDRIMVEYDVGQSGDEYLEILSLDRVEQMAAPLAAINWPNDCTLNPEEHRVDIPMLLFANDENKYKILNYQTTMTLATILGPRYDTPVCRLKLVAGKDGKGDPQPYLLFATKTVIGMNKMPLDGNPWKHVGVMGHPTQITGWCFRDDLGTLFTIGAKDTCMVQWAAKFRSVNMTSKQGGIDLDPYYCIIEDGRPGWLFQEIRDLFYYIQILCQGTFSPAIRHVKDFIPIASLPDLMRALGFFPTEYEVENLIVEAVYKVSQRQPSIELDFEEFVKLYLNHRPACGDSVLRVRNAFRNFAQFRGDTYVLARDELLHVLSDYGECFSSEVSWYLLSILCGRSFEDRATMLEDDFSFMPSTITYSDFVSQLLGIEVDPSDRYSIIESECSGQTSSASGTSTAGLNRFE